MALEVRYDPRDHARLYVPGGGRQHPLVIPASSVVVGLWVLVVWGVMRWGFP